MKLYIETTAAFSVANDSGERQTITPGAPRLVFEGDNEAVFAAHATLRSAFRKSAPNGVITTEKVDAYQTILRVKGKPHAIIWIEPIEPTPEPPKAPK